LVVARSWPAGLVSAIRMEWSSVSAWSLYMAGPEKICGQVV
jgi:hypothetical protein